MMNKTIKPIIGVPCKGSYQGLDALLSIMQMPPGIPVATVAIDGAKNAGLLAVQMLAISDDELRGKFISYKKEMAEASTKYTQVPIPHPNLPAHH